MNIKIIIIIVIVYLYGLFEYYVHNQQKKKSKIVSVRDKGSLWFIMVSISVGYLLSFSIAATKIGRIYYWDIFFALGLLIIAIGLIIRIISIRQLGQYFTYSVSTVKNHMLMENGLYKFIRHPGYLGQLLIFTGIAISLSNWLSVILMFISTLVGYLNRIRVEEKFLTEQMGDKYSNYQNRTYKLIPKIY
jgi:protein-S-isoprenylcysteine O-methyltransferase Ste14